MPYSYGWSIVALTLVVKLATFPLTKKQVGHQGWLGRTAGGDVGCGANVLAGVVVLPPPQLAYTSLLSRLCPCPTTARGFRDTCAFMPYHGSQVESALNIQKLKPQIDAIKAQVGAAGSGCLRCTPVLPQHWICAAFGPTTCPQYGEDKDAISRETSALYEKAGVDPLAGVLPALPAWPARQGVQAGPSPATGTPAWGCDPAWRAAESCCSLPWPAAQAACPPLLPSPSSSVSSAPSPTLPPKTKQAARVCTGLCLPLCAAS